MRATLFLWCCACTSNIPLVLCSMAPDFFKQRDNVVPKPAISISCSVYVYDFKVGVEAFLSLYARGYFSNVFLPFTGFQPHPDAAPQPPRALGDATGSCLSHSDCLVCPPVCCTTASPSPGRHHRHLPVPQWLSGLSSFIHLQMSESFGSGQAMVLWPPDHC